MDKSGPQVQKQAVNNDKTKGGTLQRRCACGQHTIGGGACDHCQEGRMQRFASGAADGSTAPPIVNDVLRSPGHPLDAASSASFGELLDHDFSQVRLHTDARAAESARSVNALAYTVGRDIVFGSGQYAPGAPAGRRLLAHELTHVVQQSGGTGGPSANLEIGPVDDAWEREADATADSLTKGTRRTGRQIVPGKRGQIQREPDQSAQPQRAPETIPDTAADQGTWRTRVDAAVRSQYGLRGPGMTSGQVSFVSQAEFARRFPASEMEDKLYTIFLTWGRSWTAEPGQILDFNQQSFFVAGETPTSTEQLRKFIKQGISAGTFRGQSRERDVSTGGRFPVFTRTPQQLIAQFIAGITEVSVPRASRQITIQARSNVDTLVHEACHFYVSDGFRDMARRRRDGEEYIGNARISQILMEGFAEYFSRQVMRANEAVFGPTVGGYDAEVEQVHRIHASLGEAALRAAYFGGDAAQIRRVNAAVDEYKDAPEDWYVPGFVVDAHLAQRGSQPVQRKARNDAPRTPASADAPSIVHDVLRSEGMPLDAGARAFFEPRFRQNFSEVRVHTDEKAAESARRIDAYAYTVGRDIVFGAGQFAPESVNGRRLLAHELTHVMQQSAVPAAVSPRLEIGSPDSTAERQADHFADRALQGSVAAEMTPQRGLQRILQRACAPPAGTFELSESNIGRLIREGLSTVTIPGPGPANVPQPRVNPAAVLDLLNSSNCFLRDAGAVERFYFPATGRPTRTPALRFDFHERPERGTSFAREGSRITVEVTSLPEVVSHIVHEVAHASHSQPAAAPGPAAGAITRAEEAGVREEGTTRARENEIMAEITGTAAWARLTGGAAATPEATRPEDVRGSFKSGLPRLTYQEHFIIEELKSRNRFSTLNEAEVRGIARTLLPFESVGRDPAPRFDITPDRIANRRATARSTAPPEPPSFIEARECVRLHAPAFRRSGTLPADASCAAFLESARPYLDSPSDEVIVDLIRELQRKHTLRTTAISESRDFVGWYDRVPNAEKPNAIRYLEWVTIAERISDEWGSADTPDPEVRRRHLDFLEDRIGVGLRGISRPRSSR